MKKLIWVSLTISVFACILGILQIFSAPKIAYIRSSELIYSYDGMKESQQLFQAKKEANQANIDTLRIELEKAISVFNIQSYSFTSKEKIDKEKMLQQQKENYMRYVQSIKEMEESEDRALTQGVLNQVNTFVEQYAKDHGYDIILGTTASGNLLYGNEAMDITKVVLEALNSNYKKSN